MVVSTLSEPLDKSDVIQNHIFINICINCANRVMKSMFEIIKYTLLIVKYYLQLQCNNVYGVNTLYTLHTWFDRTIKKTSGQRSEKLKWFAALSAVQSAYRVFLSEYPVLKMALNICNISHFACVWPEIHDSWDPALNVMDKILTDTVK